MRYCRYHCCGRVGFQVEAGQDGLNSRFKVFDQIAVVDEDVPSLDSRCSIGFHMSLFTRLEFAQRIEIVCETELEKKLHIGIG